MWGFASDGKTFASDGEREYAIELLARALTRLGDYDKHVSMADTRATIDAQNILIGVIIQCAETKVQQ